MTVCCGRIDNPTLSQIKLVAEICVHLASETLLAGVGGIEGAGEQDQQHRCRGRSAGSAQFIYKRWRIGYVIIRDGTAMHCAIAKPLFREHGKAIRRIARMTGGAGLDH